MVRDPDFRTTPKGTPVCRFTIASNRFYKTGSGMEKEAGFFDIETWGEKAESCNEYGRKGKEVRVVGRLKQDSWTDNDGKKHSKIIIVADQAVEFKPEQKREFSQEAAAEGYER